MTASDPASSFASDRASGTRPGLRWAELATAVVLVLGTGYLIAACLVALVLATAKGAHFSLSTVLYAALPGWLAAHQVPLTIMGARLTVLPLLPTLAVLVLIGLASAALVRRARLRSPGQAARVVGAMTISHALAGTAIALALGPAIRVVPVEALLWCAVTAAIASTVGVAHRCGLMYLLWTRVDDAVWSGFRAGLLALTMTLVAGCVVVLVGLCLSAPEQLTMLRAGSPGDAIGKMALSLLFLPNALVSGWSFTAGTGFSWGAFSVSPFGMTGGHMLQLPLLAALPSAGHGQRWWLVVFVLALLPGTVIGWWCRGLDPEPRQRWCAVSVAALIGSAGALLSGWVVSGHLGSGAGAEVTLRPGTLGLVTFCWILVPAALVTWVAGPSATAVSEAWTDEITPEIPDTPEELVSEQPGVDDEGTATEDSVE